MTPGCAYRELNSPRRPPAMWMCTPSKTRRPSSSTFMPSERKWRRKRPDCDAPVARAKSTRPAAGLPSDFARVAQPRHRVAHREEPGTGDRAARGAVHDLVDAARLEAAVERDVVGIDEPPRRPVDRRRLAVGSVLDREHRVGGVEIGGRVRQRRRQLRVERETGEAHGVARGRGLHPHPDRARDRHAVVVERLGRGEADHARAADDVPLPARPRHRVAAPQEEAVAGLDAIGRARHRERADAQRQARRPTLGWRRCRAGRDFPRSGRRDGRRRDRTRSRPDRTRRAARDRGRRSAGSRRSRGRPRTGARLAPLRRDRRRRTAHRLRTARRRRTRSERQPRGEPTCGTRRPPSGRRRGRDREAPGTPRTPSRRASTTR